MMSLIGSILILLGILILIFVIWVAKNNSHVATKIEDVHPDFPFTDQDES